MIRLVTVRALNGPVGRATLPVGASVEVGDRVRLINDPGRLPVATVIENLEDLSIDEVIDQFDVTREQVAAVLEFVAQSLRASDVPAGAHPL